MIKEVLVLDVKNVGNLQTYHSTCMNQVMTVVNRGTDVLMGFDQQLLKMTMTSRVRT